MESIHRKAIKTALSMKPNIPNDIVYIESGYVPLIASIRKRQHKFWGKVKEDMAQNPESPITKLYVKALDKKLPMVKPYINLLEKFKSEEEYYVFYCKEEHDIKIRLRDAAMRDPDGIKGTYLKINTNLNCPKFYTINMINESNRNISTKYRTGSHLLNIQKGRYNRVDRITDYANVTKLYKISNM